jgi:hypothetical protein
MGADNHRRDNTCRKCRRHSGRCPGQVAHCDLLYCCRFFRNDLLLQEKLAVEAILGDYWRSIPDAFATRVGGFWRRLAAKG